MFRIILTRSEEDINRDRSIFEREGFEVVSLPLVKTVGLDFELPKEDFDFVIFQSAKAVKYFFDKNRLKGSEKIIAVGEATGKALESYGYCTYMMPENYYAEEVKHLIKGEKVKVLIPRSREGRESLIMDLKEMGFHVYAVDVYTTQYVLYRRDEFLRVISKGNMIVFASPSAVKSFFANLPKDEGIRVLKEKIAVCIGKTTNEELISLSGLCGLLPEKPSMKSVVKLIKSLV